MKIRNKIIFAIAVVLSVVLSTTLANAQGLTEKEKRERAEHTPLPDQYQEYIYNLNLFYNDRKQFESDKSKYIAYKTVQSKEDALASSKLMLDSSRKALLTYIQLLESNVMQQEDFNTRVKNGLQNDIATHKTYLLDSAQTVQGITTLEQATTVSNALNLRYTYIKLTSTLSLTYIDVLTAKKRNDSVREIVLDFKNIMGGYPEENRSREIVDRWTEDILPQLADNESLLNNVVEQMYPSTTKDNVPVYEVERLKIETDGLETVNNRHRQYNIKFKEINQIARDAYKEL